MRQCHILVVECMVKHALQSVQRVILTLAKYGKLMYIVTLYNISLYGKPIKGTGECKFSAFYNVLQNLKNDNDRFLQIFLQLKHLHINLNTLHDLRQIAAKFVKSMNQLLTLHIWLIEINQPNDIPQWEGIINNISYEIAKRHIKIWK